MAYLLGENVNLGIGGESAAARGTGVAPSAWIPARTPTGIRPIVEKTQLRETLGAGVRGQGSVITQTRAEGDLEFNLRAKSIGWLLQSLLGSSSSVAKSAPNAAVYDHTFSLLTSNPQHPTLTLGLAQQGQQHYEYRGAVVQSLEIRTPVDDLVNATASFISRGEAEHANYTVGWDSSDYYFRPQDISIKLATDTTGLGAATPISVKDFSLTINNNARPDMNLGSATPADVLALLLEIGGSVSLDYTDKTYHDLFTAGTYRAMRITMTRSDVTIGSSANPQIQIDLPKISFEDMTFDRPLDDTVKQGLSFMAHYDTTTSKAISAVVTNTQTTYTVA
jgi:hypothetical protein